MTDIGDQAFDVAQTVLAVAVTVAHGRVEATGSGDALFSWVDEIIRKTWREQHFSPPRAEATRPTMQRFPDRDWVDRQPSSDHEVDPRPSPTGQEALLASRSDVLGRGTADGAGPQLPWNREAERFRGFEVEDQVLFLWKHDGKILRLGSVEDAAGV